MIQLEFDVAGAENGANPPFCNMLDDDGQPIGSRKRTSSDPTHFQFLLPSAGRYTIQCRQYGESDNGMFGATTLQVDRDMAGLRLAMAPLSTIPVFIAHESTKNDSTGAQSRAVAGVQLRLRSLADDRRNPGSFAQRDPKNGDRALFRAVEPGPYQLEYPENTWYIASATFRGRDVWHEPLEIGPGQSGEINVVLRDDVATLTGTVINAGAMGNVLIVDDARPQSPQRVFINSEGKFQTQLAPGHYRVYAFAPGMLDRIEYANPKALERFAADAQDVRLGANETRSLRLTSYGASE
jgi:hypothetical protein